MDDMPTGLTRRAATYALRRRIPKDLVQSYGGRLEIVKSLGTKDREEAKRLHALAWVDLDREFEIRRARSTDPDAHIRAKLIQIKDAWRRAPRAPQTVTDEEVEYALAKSAFDAEEEFREEVEYERREIHRARLSAVLNVKNVDALSDDDRALRDLILDARADVERAEERALAAERKLAQGVTPRPTGSVPPAENHSFGSALLSEVVERWALDRQPEPKTIDAHKAVVRWFTERTGMSDARLLDRSHVQQFKAALIAEGASAENIRTKLSRLRTILEFAFTEGLTSGNPAKSVTAPRSKKPPSRVPWSSNDLNTLFDGPVHRNGMRPTQGRGEAAYWLPLLAIFTGARREELGQLRGADVVDLKYVDARRRERHTFAIHIQYGEDGRNRLKNATSERIVPVHPSLVDLGFIKFAKKAGTDELLFPELRPNKYGQLTEKWGEWFRQYRRSCGLTDPRLKFHSFRHAFKDFCREAEISEGVQRQLMGHAGSEVADLYGQGFTTRALVSAMASYKVPGIQLPPPPTPSE